MSSCLLFSLRHIADKVFAKKLLEYLLSTNLLKTVQMRICTPQRRLTVADQYFYAELRSSLGYMAAERWLSETSASCDCSHQISSVANTPTAELPTKRHASIHDFRRQSQASSLISAADTARSISPFSSSESIASQIESFSSVPALHKCHSKKLKSRIMSHSWLVRKHGEKAGLLFTDAAHILDDYSEYESDLSLCPVVSRFRSSSLADPKVSEYESDSSLCPVVSWCWSTRRIAASNDDCSSR